VQRREVVILPKKPVRRLAMCLLLRGHSGKVWFRRPHLQTVSSRKRAFRFDGVPVLARTAPTEGFQIRDVAGDGDFIAITGSALGLKLDRRLRGPRTTGSRIDTRCPRPAIRR